MLGFMKKRWKELFLKTGVEKNRLESDQFPEFKSSRGECADIVKVQARTIEILKECIEYQSSTIASFDIIDGLQENRVSLLEKYASLNEMMIVVLIDRLEMASQVHDDPDLISEGLLSLRERFTENVD